MEENHSMIFIIVTCVTLNLENGQVKYNESVVPNKGYPFGTMASFTCNCGYYLSGLESSTCQFYGHWCWGPPVCKQCKKNLSINGEKYVNMWHYTFALH